MAKSNLEWEASKAEQHAEEYWKEHGFEARLIARYQSKGVYTISKDGITDNYEVVNTITDFALMDENFERYWDIFTRNIELRRQVLATKLDAWRDKVLASIDGKSGVNTYRVIKDVDKIIADFFDHDPVLGGNE